MGPGRVQVGLAAGVPTNGVVTSQTLAGPTFHSASFPRRCVRETRLRLSRSGQNTVTKSAHRSASYLGAGQTECEKCQTNIQYNMR